MRICYFGGYDQNHPRNRVMMSGLGRCGAEVTECHSRHPIKLMRVLSLIAQFRRVRNQIDVIVVGASGHTYVPLAWVLARLSRKPLIFDAFVSIYESWVEESRRATPSSAVGRFAYLLDRLSAFLSDIVILDTEEHAAYFSEKLGVPHNKLYTVQVGADCETFVPSERTRSKPFKVLFVGSFLPLHGVDVIVQAAELLDNSPDIVVELIGDGEELPRAKETCRSSNVVFREPVPFAEYAKILSQADVALGAFGVTHKAARVVPGKVYDALAAGIPLITADTPAIRRVIRHRHNGILVPPGDPQAIADAILLLKSEPILRSRLAREGRRRFEEIGTPQIVGRKLLSICAKALQQVGAQRGVFGAKRERKL